MLQTAVMYAESLGEGRAAIDIAAQKDGRTEGDPGLSNQIKSNTLIRAKTIYTYI